MPVNPEQLWADKYAKRFAEEHAREEARREQAFLDIPATVVGEEIRMMTPVDLLILNGVESPFVCGAPDTASPGDVALFVWMLHVENTKQDSWISRVTPSVVSHTMRAVAINALYVKGIALVIYWR